MLQNRTAHDLKSNKFFAGVKETLVSSIFNPKKFVQFGEGNIVYQTGDPAVCLYIILHGEVKIKYSNSNYISTKGLNQFFGEKELIEDTKRISSVVANRNTLLYLLDRNLFKRLFSNYKEIKNNVTEFGELQIPDVQVEQKVNLNISERTKPVSFKAFGSKDKKEPTEKEPAKNNEPTDFTLSTEIVEIEEEEEVLNENSGETEEVTEDELEDLSKWKFNETGETPDEQNKQEITEPVDQVIIDSPELEIPDQPAETPEPVQETEREQEPPETIEEKETSNKQEEEDFERENFRKILACIGVIHQGLSLFETSQSVAKGLKELALAESAEVYLVNEAAFEMKKFIMSEESFAEEKFSTSEGLTGSCLLQKKVINLERPTEDSRFDGKIDQPGNARMKRILYFPIINEAGETIAVIQLGRENKKFSDTEISNLNIVSKQIETAISRSQRLQQVFLDERRVTINNLSHTIINEVQSPISIINNYVDILHHKELPEGADDVIRMLQKQANSIEDLLISLFEHIRNDIKVELKDIHFNEFIDDVLELISEYCESREIKLYKKVGDGTIVSIDRGKLYTAIYQIIRQFSDQVGKGGKIYLSSELHNNSIILLIKNEPSGFIKGSINKLLEKSITGELERDPNSEFNIARKIVEAHGGNFNIEFLKGEGTFITITLPGKEF
jgi:signal transduction histidine kinase